MPHQPIRALTLLSALTKGGATIHDLDAELRRLGLNFSYSELLEKTRTKINPRIVQRVPQVPFSLNGTMYDPKDIIRFNGQELHFVLAPSGDHMLVVDNIELLKIWEILADHEISEYRTMRQSSGVTPTHTLPHLPHFVPPPPGGSTGGGVHPLGAEFPDLGAGLSPELPSPGLSLPPYNPPTWHLTNLFSNANYTGYNFVLRGAVSDLRLILLGYDWTMRNTHGATYAGVQHYAGYNTWNRRVTSLKNLGIYPCRLYEDKNFRGESLTTYEWISDLAPLGWDYRVQSVRND